MAISNPVLGHWFFYKVKKGRLYLVCRSCGLTIKEVRHRFGERDVKKK